MKASESLSSIDRTSTLQFDSNTRKYILLVPKVIEKRKIQKNKLDCGIDPGVRSFLTVYSKNNTYSICDNNAYNDNIKTIQKKNR